MSRGAPSHFSRPPLGGAVTRRRRSSAAPPGARPTKQGGPPGPNKGAKLRHKGGQNLVLEQGGLSQTRGPTGTWNKGADLWSRSLVRPPPIPGLGLVQEFGPYSLLTFSHFQATNLRNQELDTSNLRRFRLQTPKLASENRTLDGSTEVWSTNLRIFTRPDSGNRSEVPPKPGPGPPKYPNQVSKPPQNLVPNSKKTRFGTTEG